MLAKLLHSAYRCFFLALFILPFNSSSAAEALDFQIIPIHYELLNDEPHTWQENEGLTPFTVANNVNQGDTQILLSGNTNLHDSELIVYLSTSGIYHVAQVASINGNTITLTKGLEEAIEAGDNLWNFYENSSHPNAVGYKALADFALSKLDINSLQNKIHGFDGDSWFDDAMGGIFENRIKNRVNAIQTINAAVGGSQSIDTLTYFDEHFPASSYPHPDYIWLSLGTNDYWSDVSPENYITHMEALIRKINKLGAKAIVLDSSVGPYIYDQQIDGLSRVKKDLSDGYADKLHALINSQGGSSSGGSSSGGSSSSGSSSSGSSSGGSSSGGSSSGGSSSGGYNSGSSGSGSSGSGSSGSGGSGSGGSGSGGSSSGGSSSGGSSSGGSSSGGSSSGSSIVPSQGGGSIFFLEFLLLSGLIVRKLK